MKEKTLVVWFKDGSTAYFEKVTDFRENPTLRSVTFNYLGVSTGVKRNATIQTNNIAIHALED